MIPVDNYQIFDPTKNHVAIPNEPGNYIVCLKPECSLPGNEIPEYKTINILGLTANVVYTGISKDSLYNRIYKIHLTGNNAGKSTLRKSLGSLMNLPFTHRDKNPNPIKSPKTKFKDEDESKLTLWMKENLFFLFVATPNCETEEEELINTFNPPLNLDKNKNTVNAAFRAHLSVLRNRPITQ